MYYLRLKAFRLSFDLLCQGQYCYILIGHVVYIGRVSLTYQCDCTYCVANCIYCLTASFGDYSCQKCTGCTKTVCSETLGTIYTKPIMVGTNDSIETNLDSFDLVLNLIISYCTNIEIFLVGTVDIINQYFMF